MTTTGGTAAGTESFTYDKAGNTTSRTGGPRPQEYTWDAEGHLATVTENGKKTEYAYDSAGQRILAANADGSTTAYLPGGNELKVSASGTATAQRYYTHNGETIATRDGKGFTYLFPDHQGTAMLAVTWGAGQLITRRKQLPFGAPRATTGTDWPGDRGFVGGTTDPTGYTHLGAREYDPTLGRFLSVDPLLLTDDPTQHNPYTYANNNPVTYADPTGEAYEECGKVITCGKGGVPHKPKKPNTAVSGGNPGSPGNSGSYVPWTPGSKKRIKADPSKGRYNSYGHLGHNSYGQTTYAAQEEYARAAAEEERRQAIAASKARQKKNQQEAGFWGGIKNNVTSLDWWKHKGIDTLVKTAAMVGTAACIASVVCGPGLFVVGAAAIFTYGLAGHMLVASDEERRQGAGKYVKRTLKAEAKGVAYGAAWGRGLLGALTKGATLKYTRWAVKGNHARVDSMESGPRQGGLPLFWGR